MEWLTENWVAVAAGVSAGVLFFDRLAKLTPTKSDDALVAKLYKLFAVMGIKVKDNPGKEE